MKYLKKIQLLLNRKQKQEMVMLVVLMFVGALLEVAGIGSLVLVVRAVMLENAIQENEMLSRIYEFLPLQNEEQFIILILLAMIFIFVAKNIFLFFKQKKMYGFVYKNQFETSERLMKNYMRRDYEFFLNADTTVIQRSITSDVNNMYALILSLLQLMSDLVMAVFLIISLISTDYKMTLMIAILLIITLGIIKNVFKPILKKAGEDNQNYYSGLFKLISQTMTGIKEVKIAGKEQYFVDQYVNCGKGYVAAVQKYSVYNNTPRLLIETVFIIGIVIYLIILKLSGVEVVNMIGTLTAFVGASVILMPCANRINNHLNNMAYFEPFFMGVNDNLQDEISLEHIDMSFAKDTDEKLPLKEALHLKDVSYRYPNTEKWIFHHADMEIPIGSAVGIVGSSGSGKTTVVDILLGLLTIETGKISADHFDIKENYRSWLKNIGYIPQMIFMLDDTILNNVAFGVPKEQISLERVWSCLKEAQLENFVKSLPEGLQTGIGERGIRLSGGQRQRIGIARALYNNPDILILDEATSALDHDTEAAIMESINHFKGKKTLIIIAHRLQTIEKCDMVYRIENGKATLEKSGV